MKCLIPNAVRLYKTSHELVLFQKTELPNASSPSASLSLLAVFLLVVRAVAQPSKEINKYRVKTPLNTSQIFFFRL